ncbi:MAG: protease inhibitor I42 family protein [Alphaproteobacteria bacterium]|nr:protease inhibitor I42 family protein [Alphaproteobacteria bacterium]
MKTLTKAFNTATVEKGERFRIELEADSTTGYLWDIRLKAGAASLVSQQYKRQEEPGEFVCGGQAIEELVYQAGQQSGQTIEIEATYSRPFVPNDPTADKRLFRITVA